MHHAPELEPFEAGKYANTYSPHPETERIRAGENASVSKILRSDGKVHRAEVLGGCGYRSKIGRVGCAVTIP